jgi:peptidoglycan-associated lipoprotein
MLADIFFDFDRFDIRSDARPLLESDAQWLKHDLGQKVLIEGHCDERGTTAYNLVLGEKRARSARQYLTDLGVSSARMEIVSYGEARPFCMDHNEACWHKNRRAHFAAR